MTEISANRFRANLKSAVDECVANHQPLKVRRKSGEDFVVLSARDWEAIEETLHLNQVPGLVKSIQKAAKEPLEKGTRLEDLKW